MKYQPETQSGKIDWATPQWFFDYFNEIFNFTLDVCANQNNFKCKPYFTINENGLIQNWNKINWMNPPYGNEITEWIKKAYNEGKKGNVVVCLLPSRTDNQWFHRFIMKAHTIIFIEGRLHFSNSEQIAQFGQMVVIFNNHQNSKPIVKSLSIKDIQTHQNYI